jgi:hypothetical protein
MYSAFFNKPSSLGTSNNRYVKVAGADRVASLEKVTLGLDTLPHIGGNLNQFKNSFQFKFNFLF